MPLVILLTDDVPSPQFVPRSTTCAYVDTIISVLIFLLYLKYLKNIIFHKSNHTILLKLLILSFDYPSIQIIFIIIFWIIKIYIKYFLNNYLLSKSHIITI